MNQQKSVFQDIKKTNMEELQRHIINLTPLVIISRPGENPSHNCVNHQHTEIPEALSQRDNDTSIRITNEHLAQLEQKSPAKPQQISTDLEEVFNQ